MAGEPLDTVVYALDVDLGPMKAKGVQADAEFTKISASAKAKLGNLFEPASASAGKMAGEVEKARQRMSPFFADTAAGQQKLYGLQKAFDETTAAVTRSHGSAATATREFRALFDELSSGRTRQTPGTLAIIATRVFGISGATLAWGAALAAIPVALAAAAIQADQAYAKIQRVVAATGGASGASASQIAMMAQGLNGVNGMSIPGAQGVLGGLAARGNVSVGLLPGAAQAASGYGLAEGLKQDKAVEAFEQALADPTKGAKELNAQMKLLSAAQVREISDLEASGNVEAAQKVIIDAMNERTKNASASLSDFDKMVQGAGRGLANFWAALGRGLGGGRTAEENAFSASAAIATMTAAEKEWERENPKADPTSARASLAQNVAQQQAIIDAARDQTSLATGGGPGAQRSKAITDALDQYRGKLDVAGKKLEDESNARQAITTALGYAKAQLADDKARNRPASEIAADQKNLRDLQTMAANAGNPNYKWGSGVPDKVKNLGLSADSAVEDATKNELQARIALTRSLTQRAALEAQLYKIEDDARKTALQRKVSDGTLTAASAARAQAIDDQARSERDQKAQRDLLEKQQDETAAFEKQIASYKIEELRSTISIHATAQQRLAAELQILDAEQKLAREEQERSLARNPNLTDAQKAQERSGLASAQAAQRSAAVASGQREIDAPVKALQEEIDLQQLSLNLKYADATQRAQEIADLRLRNELIKEGYKAGSDDYNAEYQRRAPLVQKQAALSVAESTPNAQVTDDLRKGLEDLGVTGATQFNKMGDAARNFALQLEQMTIRLYIMRPLLNMLFGTGGGGAGGGAPSLGGVAASAATGGQGGGLMGSLFGGLVKGVGSLFGMGGGAAGSSAAGISGVGSSGFMQLPAAGNIASAAGSNGLNLLGSLGSLFGGGFADGGYIDPAKFYLVGEKGPEILGPGLKGAISPITAPSAGAMGGGGGQMNVTHSYHVTVSGNGDKELMARMQTAASGLVQAGISQYAKTASRTQRSQFVSQQKKALY